MVSSVSRPAPERLDLPAEPADLKAAIVGAGYIARAHADAYQSNRHVELVAVVDPVPDKARRLAESFGAATAHSLSEVLDSDVDIISLCTPSHTHADLAELALSAGKHVLCEKPIARTLADSQRLVTAAETARGLLMVGHVSRFEPDHQAAYEVIAAGGIGAVRMMSQAITSSFPTWSQDSWLSDPKRSGGPLVDLGIHSIDFLNWISGSRPCRVHAVGTQRPEGLIDHAIATIRYQNGAMAVVETGWAQPESQGLTVSTEIAGTEGRLTWDYAGIAVGKVHSVTQPPRDISPLGSRGFHLEIAAFVNAIRHNDPSPVPAAEAQTALRVALAALESIETGTVVELSYPTEER